MAKKGIGTCIVGLGRAGHFHLRSIGLIPGMFVKSIVDPHVSEEHNSYPKGIPKSDFQSVLIDPDIDAVIISTPTGLHYSLVSQALSNGKHVFAEKPLGKTIEEIQKCYEIARENQVRLFVGFQRRYDKNFLRLKQAMNDVGTPQLIKTSSRDHPRPSINYLSISGNIFHDMLIHDFDMLCFLLEADIPSKIHACGWCYDAEIAKLQDFDTVMVTIQYPNGLMVNIDTSRMAPYGYDQRIEVFGSRSMVIAENERDTTIEIHTKSGVQKDPINYSFPQRYRDAYLQELIAFNAGIGNEPLFNISEKACLLSHLMADAAYLSATKNVVIDFQKDYAHFIQDLV